MGNWRTVRIEGKVSPEQAADMIEWLHHNEKMDWNNVDWDTYEEHPIEYLQMNRSLSGINQWVNEDGTIDCNGNLSSKSPSESAVLRELTILVGHYDTLELVLHLGGDYESEHCVASFVVKDGKVEQCDPMVETVTGVSEETVQQRFFGFITGHQ